jgi:hypothetical protein
MAAGELELVESAINRASPEVKMPMLQAECETVHYLQTYRHQVQDEMESLYFANLATNSMLIITKSQLAEMGCS